MLSIGDDSSSVLVKDAARKIRVGMVLDQPFPFNDRVEREAVALTEAGFEVHLLCADFSDGPVARKSPLPKSFLKDEAHRGFYIHRVNPDEVSIEIPVLRRQSRFLYREPVKNYFYHFRNIDTAWHTLIHRFVKNYGIQILHVHGLRLVDTGLNIAFRYGLPLIADLPEGHSAFIQSHPERERWEKTETESVQRASRVITTTEEDRESLIRKGLPAEKTLTLENTLELEKFIAAPIDQELVRRFRPSFVLTYVGPLYEPRQGIQTVIEAMALLKDEIPELQFIAAGDIKESYYQQLSAMIESAGLRERVHFTGPMDDVLLMTYIEASDLCLCPSLNDAWTNSSFPEAVYWYHLFKKPVLASNISPLRRYLENTGGGLSFQAGDARMLADLIRMLHSRPDIRREMAFRGHQAIMERYQWKHTARELIGLYKALVPRTARTFA